LSSRGGAQNGAGM